VFLCLSKFTVCQRKMGEQPRKGRNRKADTNKCTAFCVAITIKDMDKGQTRKGVIRVHPVQGRRTVLDNRTTSKSIHAKTGHDTAMWNL